MKKIISSLALIFIVIACKKEQGIPDKQAQSQPEDSQKKPSPPPNANPVFTYQDYKNVSNNLFVPGIYVMDITGANPTAVYTNYSRHGNNTVINTPDFPAWSGDGSKLCFILNQADLYTMSVSVVNGVSTGSNATKIGDGVAGGGSYEQGKWRPGANEIASVWKRGGDPDKIRIIPAAGGSPTDLYTAQGIDWFIEDDITFNSSGTNLAFSERQVSTGSVYLKVIDVTNAQVIKSINLNQYKSIKELDWTKSPGSNIVAITTIPLCDNTTIGYNGIHQLQTVDVSSASPSLTLVHNDVGNISYSPNDNQIATNAGLSRAGGTGCSFSQYDGLLIYTFATNNFTFPSYRQGNHHDWKR